MKANDSLRCWVELAADALFARFVPDASNSPSLVTGRSSSILRLMVGVATGSTPSDPNKMMRWCGDVVDGRDQKVQCNGLCSQSGKAGSGLGCTAYKIKGGVIELKLVQIE